VTGSYDAVNDRVVLANNTTGDLGMTLSESAGGVLGALGLSSGYTAVAGKNAEYSIDGGPTLISASNTLDGTAHGIAGLSVTVNSFSTQTITVGADTAKMRVKIQDFISAYNAVQSYIDDKSKITSANGKVTTSVLSSNRDVQDWARQLRQLAFKAVPGLSDTIKQISDFGLDLDRDGQLSIADSTKLDTALADHPTDIEKFFNTSSTGFAAKFDTLVGKLISSSSDSQDRLAKTNSALDTQIADMERRLVQQRELLTNSFIAMESAQSKIQQQSQAISNAFGISSGSDSKK
jgi:flagellar hook-associated protein 2